MRRVCAQCDRVLEFSDDLLPSIKAMTWVEGEQYASVEIDGWVLVWWETAGHLMAACPCVRHMMPNHEDGEVIALLPAGTAENS